MGNEFKLKFSYGIGSNNVLNTFEDTYTKDLIADGTITIPFKLTENELSQIYDKMCEIGFFDYPDTFNGTNSESTLEIDPFYTYIFKVRHGNSEKHLHWDDCCMDIDPRLEKLGELGDLIKEIIESRMEYKQLPETRGGYC